MSAFAAPGATATLEAPRGSHVCWVLADPQAFRPAAEEILARGSECNEKIFVFGPRGGAAHQALEHVGATMADPYADFLGGGKLEPDIMLSMFRDETGRALSDGYEGIRLVADMDWLLPAAPSSDDTIAFELLLDRTVRELGATVICAYRSGSFDVDLLHGTAAVHPVVWGVEPAFRLVAGEHRSWALTGEIDLAAVDEFAAAIKAAAADGGEIDVGGLRFMDCAGMRAMAQAMASQGSIHLRSIPGFLSRSWKLAGFDKVARLG